jgi:glutamate N-acetyltransferase/amino-acid N-acetyltransferase
MPVDRALGVTAPAGFRAGAAAVGVKKLSKKPDVGLLACETDAQAAAVFTQNKVCAAPVTVCREHLAARRTMRGIVANSGNANACTGRRGLADARAMARLAAARIGCPEQAVLVASTGVIGRLMPMDKVATGIERAAAALAHGPEADLAFARAIMTTDTRPKQAGVRFRLRGRTVTVAGATKGVGMIAPNLATTLGFLTTDAPVRAALLRKILRRAADATYNCLTVDGHTSTNDTLVILASGLAMDGCGTPVRRRGERVRGRTAEGGCATYASQPIAEGSAEAAALEAAVFAVCDSLARQIADDGEGATKTIEILVTGAATDAEARRAAGTIANSPLVKTAFFGEDPNWGRIVSAAGYAGISSGPETMRLALGGLVIFNRGTPVAAHAAHLKAVMKAHDIAVHLDLGAGKGTARYLTCDFSYDYVKINAEYTT